MALLSSPEPEPELGRAQTARRERKTARASLPRAGRSQAELMKRLDRSGGARRACAPGAPAVSSLAGARGFDGTARATRSPARAGTSFGELWDRTAAALRIGAAHRRRAKKLALGPPELESCIRRSRKSAVASTTATNGPERLAEICTCPLVDWLRRPLLAGEALVASGGPLRPGRAMKYLCKVSVASLYDFATQKGRCILHRWAVAYAHEVPCLVLGAVRE